MAESVANDSLMQNKHLEKSADHNGKDGNCDFKSKKASKRNKQRHGVKSSGKINNNKKKCEDKDGGECKSEEINKNDVVDEVHHNEEKEVALISSKKPAETKAIATTSKHDNHQATGSKSPLKTFEHLFRDNNDGKILVIPVVMLATNDIPLHKISQRSANNFIMQQEVKPTDDQIQKQIVTTKQSDKPLPKKRGLNREIDVQNEKLEEYNRNKTTSQNEAKMDTSVKKVEPPAKKTRKNLGLRDDSMNNSARLRSMTFNMTKGKDKDGITRTRKGREIKKVQRYGCN